MCTNPHKRLLTSSFLEHFLNTRLKVRCMAKCHSRYGTKDASRWYTYVIEASSCLYGQVPFGTKLDDICEGCFMNASCTKLRRYSAIPIIQLQRNCSLYDEALLWNEAVQDDSWMLYGDVKVPAVVCACGTSCEKWLMRKELLFSSFVPRKRYCYLLQASCYFVYFTLFGTECCSHIDWLQKQVPYHSNFQYAPSQIQPQWDRIPSLFQVGFLS